MIEKRKVAENTKILDNILDPQIFQTWCLHVRDEWRVLP